jgi:hypothetical protein
MWSCVASARTTGVGDWMEVSEWERKRSQDCGKAKHGGSESDERKKKGEWGQPRPKPLYL